MKSSILNLKISQGAEQSFPKYVMKQPPKLQTIWQQTSISLNNSPMSMDYDGSQKMRNIHNILRMNYCCPV